MASGTHREAALALTTASVERFADLGDTPGHVDLLAQHARFLFMLHRMPEAIAMADRVLPIAERLDRLQVVVELLITRGTALASSGREYEGIAVLEGGLKLAITHGLTASELRARINLSGLMGAYDPAAAYAIADTGAELAMRLGLRGYAPSLIGNAAVNALETGDWDPTIARLRRAIDTAGGVEDAVAQYEFFIAQFAAIRGLVDDAPTDPDVELVHRSRAYLQRLIAAGDASLAPNLHYLDALTAEAAGRFRDAYEHVIAAAREDEFNASPSYAWAIDLAALMADPGAVERAMAGLRDTGSHSPMSRIGLRTGQASLDALAGRRREALAGFREVLVALTAMGCVWTRSVRAVAMGTLLGAGDPEVRRAVEEACDTFERLGVDPFVVRASDLLAAEAAVPDPVPARARVQAPTSGAVE
jgi:hypothetical protein